MRFPDYSGRDHKVKRFAEELGRFFRGYPDKDTLNGGSGVPKTSQYDSNAGPVPSSTFSTGSNFTVAYSQINETIYVDATGAITITVPVMEPGDYLTVTSDSGSAGNITVNNPSASGLVELIAGHTTTVRTDVTGAYYVGKGTDATAIHSDLAGEITSITTKLVPAANDSFIYEDSAASDVKKTLTYANLTAAILDNVSLTGTQTGSYTALTSNTTLGTHHTVDCTSGTFTVTLPTAASASGLEYRIKNSGSGQITVAGHKP